MSETRKISSYTEALTAEQASLLREILQAEGYEFNEKPYTLFAARKGKLNIAVYEKGPKIVIQGKDTMDFVQFTLEPKVLGEAKLGYEEVHHPEMFEPHIGIDESGKGDFFGPLVIAAAFTDQDSARALINAGVQDSKRIGSDARIKDLAEAIRATEGFIFETVTIGPAKYNELYEKIGNLNRLLAWGHSRALENLLGRTPPDCERAVSDQFANPTVLKRALLEKGREIELVQRTKAESDIAVAAASILAREQFVLWMERHEIELNLKLPKGASARVKEAAREILSARGPEYLPQIAKMHFKTAAEVLGQLPGM